MNIFLFGNFQFFFKQINAYTLIMGCASSNQEDAKDAKTKTNGTAKGGATGEAAEIEPVAPKQNPYMSLTHKDTFHLKMSWKGIKRSLEETGINMFMK